MRHRLLTTIVLAFICFQSVWAGTKRALIIGLSQYPKYRQAQLDWQNIHGANDAVLISKTLRKQGFRINLLTNRQATAQSIRKALRTFEIQTQKGDLVYIHFSGHGQPVEDKNGDEPDGWDEALVPYNAGQRYMAHVYTGQNHIIDDELNVYITNIRKKAGKTGFVYVVIDACHAGDSSRGEEEENPTFVRGSNIGFSKSGKAFIPRIDTRPVIRIAGGANMAATCYLEACRSYQTNAEIKVGTQYFGPLSFYVNKVLCHHNLNANTAWTENVRRLMNADKRLIRQNMVIEKTKQ
ncbi:MAG: caspase family protein [Prevotella sp.]|nr:caspase family protein [Prevotella sp.]